MATLAATLTATSASAAEQGAVTVEEPGLVQTTFADGSSQGWVSEEYLAAHPDAVPGVRSAFSCDQNVCIQVVGEGLTVRMWGTKALGNEGCIRATFRVIIPGMAPSYQVKPPVCPTSSGPGVYWNNTGRTGQWPQHTNLGNGWEKIGGFPTETLWV